MSRRAIFAYRQGLRGPSPVVFYDNIPNENGRSPQLLFRHEIEGGTGNADFSLAPTRRRALLGSLPHSLRPRSFRWSWDDDISVS